MILRSHLYQIKSLAVTQKRPCGETILMTSRSFSLSLSKRASSVKSRAGSASSTDSHSSPRDMAPTQANLFWIYFPSVGGKPRLKSAVPYVPASTLGEVIAKDCAKRGRSVNAYTIWDRNDLQLSPSTVLGSVPDKYVILQFNFNSTSSDTGY